MTIVGRLSVYLGRFLVPSTGTSAASTRETVADRSRPGAGIYVSRIGAVCGRFSSEFRQDGHKTATTRQP